MKERRYVHPRTGLGFLIATVIACVSLVLSGSSTRATTVDDLTAGLTPGVPTIAMPEGDGIGVWNEVDNATGVVLNGAVCSGAVCGRQGEWRQWPADRLLNGRLWPTGYPEGSTYIWNPIGAASWGRYYTNGLYVAANGQYVLPGETIVRTFGSDATPPPTLGTTTTLAPTVTAPGGVTGVEAYVTNSNGVRCHLTAEGYWDHSRSCVDSSRVQFALCFQSAATSLDLQGASLGMRVTLDGVTLDSTSFPPSGVSLVSGSSCRSGYLHSWAFDGAEPGRWYLVEVWGRVGGVDLTSSLVFATPAPAVPVPGSPTTSATTTTTTPDPNAVGSTTTPVTTTTPGDTVTSTTTIVDATVSAVAGSTSTTAPVPAAGQATIDGQDAPLTIVTTDTGVTAQARGVTIEVSPSPLAGDVTARTSIATTGTIEVAPLQEVEVTTSGFLPDSEVEIWLHSEPMLLARARVDDSGTLRTSVQIPSLAPTGQHRLVITGRSPAGEPVSVAMALKVTSEHAGAQAQGSTGGDSPWWTATTLLVVAALGVGAIALGARRRLRRPSS